MKIHEAFKQRDEEDKKEVAEGYRGIKIKIERSGEAGLHKKYIVDGKEIKTWERFTSLYHAKNFIDSRLEAKKKHYYQLEAVNCLYALYRYNWIPEHGTWNRKYVVNLSKDHEEAIKKAKTKVEQLNANTDYPIDLKVSSSIELEEFAYGKLEADRKKREQFAKDYPELIELFDIYDEWHNRYADLVDKYSYEVEDEYTGAIQNFSGKSLVDKRKVKPEDRNECNLVLAHRNALFYLIAEFCDQYYGNKYKEGKSLSDKQIEALIKFNKSYKKNSKKNLKRQEELDKERAKAKDVPLTDERIEFVGEIIKVKWQKVKSFNPYNDYSLAEKMVFKSDDGYVLWGTFPQTAWKFIDPTWHEQEKAKGKRISFFATVQRSKDDSKFGFYKRPTKVKVE